MLVTLPTAYSISDSILRNRIRQVAVRSMDVRGDFPPFNRGRLDGYLLKPAGGDSDILVVESTKNLQETDSRVVLATIEGVPGESLDLSAGKWLRHPQQPRPNSVIDYQASIRKVRASWQNAFAYVQEDPASGVLGLRGPQIGAAHAAHAHWTVSNRPATIVMPTGTGKTETMLSILVSAGCTRLLVVVPTDALRTQISEKFLTLGVLKTPGSNILKADSLFPIVGTLEHIPQSASEVDEIFGRCQVVVTTSAIAGSCEGTVQEHIAELCSHLFIDEAHHVEARTWKSFKERFEARKVLQFTATPFREDGKPLDGDIIYRYPLKKAQEEGYFKPIRFSPVVEFNPTLADREIAAKAVHQLRADFGRGHILMARVETIERAKRVFEIYKQYEEFNPVELHTGIKSSRMREEIRRKVISGESRIIVCVDMLGEGFDLPELKIAAFHDIRKTLAVTLQLAGRFTRTRPDLGDATFIANTADIDVQEELRKLYTRDPDWNVLLPELSEKMIGEQVALQQFLKGFTDFIDEIPLSTVRPALSTVVYRTTCAQWNPEAFREGIPGITACEQVHHTINHSENTLLVVTARRVELQWADASQIFGWDWELYVVVWWQEENLLFINSSSNAGNYRYLAEAIAGPSAKLVNGLAVFRSFSGINRLRLSKVGLSEQLGKNVRYTGRMGSDVGPAVPDAQLRNTRKSDLSGAGFEGGRKVTIGASRKGRIWSIRRNRVNELVDWCKNVGAKLIDNSIDPDEVLKGTLEVKSIVSRPAKMPVCIDWPEEIYTAPESGWFIEIDESDLSLGEVSLNLVAPNVGGALRFALEAENVRAEVELEIYEDEDGPNYRFNILGEKIVRIRRGERAQGSTVEEYFDSNPPIIWFADGSSVEGNLYAELRSPHPPYNPDKIQAWDWTGVDITKESQGAAKDSNTIQARLIRELLTKDYTLVVDDDGKGEAADVVAIKIVGDIAAPSSIQLDFFHCKYSHGGKPGGRLEDLYEVCGQAQKSISWMNSPERLTDIFTHLLRREATRKARGGTRIEKGDSDQLLTIREMSRLCVVNLRIHIVQPGVSKAQVSRPQLELLSVCENYLMETYQIPFIVVGSA